MITIVIITTVAATIPIIPNPSGESNDIEESDNGIIIKTNCSPKNDYIYYREIYFLYWSSHYIHINY